MDYCTSCRRSLNGALVCPGCGAYAPDIAPLAHRHPGAATSMAVTLEAWSPEEVPAPEAPPVGPEGGAATGRGRAARRRQLARWKKHRRRAVAATAVALFGGGLTVAALQATRPSGTHTQASSPPDPVTAAAPGVVTAGPGTAGPGTAGPDTGGTGTGGTDTAGSPKLGTATPRTKSTATPSQQAGTSAAGRQEASEELRTAPSTVRHAAQVPAQGPVQAPDQAPPPAAAAPAPAPADGGTAPQASTPQPGGAPATAERSGTQNTHNTTVAGLLTNPSTDDPTSPAQLCLIGVCLG